MMCGDRVPGGGHWLSCSRASFLDSKMQSQRLLVFILLVCLTASACAMPWAAPPGAAVVFVAALDSPVLTLDPANAIDLSSARACVQVYETLVELNPETGKIAPLLAQSWNVSPDGRVWTFTLRSGVTFHDGTPFNAAAVVDNVNRWMDTGSPYHRGDFDYWQLVFGGFKGGNSVVRSVDRADELRVRITLERPWSPLLSALAMYPFAMVSPTAMQNDVDALRQVPVGTGAFLFAGWTENEVVLAANQRYWGGAPKLAGVRLVTIADEAARLAALRNGKAHLIESAGAGAAANARQALGARVFLRPGQSTMFLSINQKAAPLDDPLVRQAIGYAINRRALVESGYLGLAQVAEEFVPPVVDGRVRETKDQYDPAMAKRLLNDAGYAGGLMTQLSYPSSSRPFLPNPRTVAESIAADLRAVGIVAALNSADWVTYQRRALDGGYALYLQGWTGDSPDPDSYLTPLFSGDSVARSIGYNSAELKAVLTTGREQVGDAARTAAYDQAADIIRADAPRVPLVHPQSPVLLADGVTGFVPSPLGMEPYRNISVGTH